VKDQAEALRRLGHEVHIEYSDPRGAFGLYKPDIVHFHTIHIGLGIGLLEWAQREHIPHCISLHDYWPFCLHNRMLLWKGDESCPAVEGVCTQRCRWYSPVNDRIRSMVSGTPTITFNPYSAEIFRRNGVEVSAVIPHGIDTDFFSPPVDIEPVDAEPAGEGCREGLVTVCAWPDSYTKGMHILKRAAIEARVPVRLVSGLPRGKVRDKLREAAIFIAPSIYQETFCLVNTEAMACGCACIASDVAGLRYQIDDGENGILVQPKDVEGLAHAMRELRSSPHLQRKLGLAAREKAVAQFSLDIMGRRYEEFYHSLL